MKHKAHDTCSQANMREVGWDVTATASEDRPATVMVMMMMMMMMVVVVVI